MDTLDLWIKKPSQMPKDAGSHEPLFTVTQVRNALAIQRSRSKKRRKRQQKRRLAGKRSAAAAAAKRQKTEAAEADAEGKSKDTQTNSKSMEFSLRTDVENTYPSNGGASANPADTTPQSSPSVKRPTRTDDDLPSEDEFEVDSDVDAFDDSDDDI